jgi:predicted enzyme related to lactoylglutathione lyase
MRAFYEEILGYEVTYAQEDTFAFLQLKGGAGPQLALYPGRESATEGEPHWFVCVDVRGIESAVERLREKGVDVTDVLEVPFGRAATFADPEGNVIQIHEPAGTGS